MLTEIWAWISNYIHRRQWDINTHPCFNLLDDLAWHSNYIHNCLWDIITHPCFNLLDDLVWQSKYMYSLLWDIITHPCFNLLDDLVWQSKYMYSLLWDIITHVLKSCSWNNIEYVLLPTHAWHFMCQHRSLLYSLQDSLTGLLGTLFTNYLIDVRYTNHTSRPVIISVSTMTRIGQF